MLDYLYAIWLTTTRACLRKSNRRRDKKDPVCWRKKPVFLRTRLLTFASFRAPLSYRITTAEISYERTTYDRARLPPRETDYVWPKVREFSMVRHAQNYARGDRISREKGSTYDTIQTTWKRLAARAKNKPAEIYRDSYCDRRHGLSSGIKLTWSVPKGVSWPQKEEVLQANPKYTCGGEKSES
jgi:hypothetical protein